MKDKSPWGDAHLALKKLWDEHTARTGISQEEFGERYDIGTQGMVSQYLRGARPLNYDAAAKFAKGFGCSIEEICPSMAETLRKEIFPLLRRSLRRRRALASIAIAGLMGSAAIEHNSICVTDFNASVRSVIHIACYRISRLIRAMKQHFLRVIECPIAVSQA
jgi:transcriptional regulator with XRE-family HTH domain